jgi:hypothetical protein
MGRSDGKLVKDIPALDRLIPHIMDRRYDATNFVKVEFDMSNLHKFLRTLRAEGHKVGIMDAVITAFTLLVQKTPELNRFIANKKIYQRNHVCVSFVILKRAQQDDQMTETAVKVYIEPDDNLLSVSRKIREIIKENEQPQNRNALDHFIDRLMGAPLIPGFLVGMIKRMDKHGILPKSIIKLSPFHTTMFISNLASIKMNYVYHHLYDFGTTSLFITLGMPRRVTTRDGNTKRVMTLGISLDERIGTGAIWAKALFEFKKALENPALLLGECKEAQEAVQ